MPMLDKTQICTDFSKRKKAESLVQATITIYF